MSVALGMRAYQDTEPSAFRLFQTDNERLYIPFRRARSPTNTHHWARASRQSLPGFPEPMTMPRKKKKRVVFADDRGLSLTEVRFFTVDPPGSDHDMLPCVQRLALEYQLGFPQPSDSDWSADTLVKLDACWMIYGAMLGKVRVYNIGPDKVVHVQITFDSWRSRHEIQCVPMHEADGKPDTELFFFNLSFPSFQNLQDRLEFRVSLRHRPASRPVWDDNGGKNYQILIEVVNEEEEEEEGEVLQVQERPQLTHEPYQPVRRGPMYGLQKIPHKSPENAVQALNWKESISPSEHPADMGVAQWDTSAQSFAEQNNETAQMTGRKYVDTSPRACSAPHFK